MLTLCHVDIMSCLGLLNSPSLEDAFSIRLLLGLSEIWEFNILLDSSYNSESQKIRLHLNEAHPQYSDKIKGRDHKICQNRRRNNDRLVPWSWVSSLEKTLSLVVSHRAERRSRRGWRQTMKQVSRCWRYGPARRWNLKTSRFS